MGAMGGAPRHVPPLEEFLGGTAPPKKSIKRKKSIKKEKIYKKWSKKSIKKEKIYKKWSKNASREVQKSKIFLPRKRGHPFSWTSSPAPRPRWCPPGKFPIALLRLFFFFFCPRLIVCKSSTYSILSLGMADEAIEAISAIEIYTRTEEQLK